MKPVVLITGAAGGLGSALVDAFQQQGWRVAAGFHHAPLRGGGVEVLPVALDVTNSDNVTAAIQSVLERWERLDALVNNAGLTLNQLLAHTSEADWERVSSVTLKGAFLVSQAVLRTMMKQRDGHIVNISSFSARSGPAGQAAYSAAKAGLIGLTQSLAKEAGPRNVRVNAVLPGVLPTPMTADLPGEVMDAFARANALGRINDVDEVARFVVFLTGMKNISGQVFQLDSRVSRWC